MQYTLILYRAHLQAATHKPQANQRPAFSTLRDVTKRCVQEHLSPLRDVYSYLHYLPHSYSLIHCVDIFYLPLDYLTCILFHLKNIYIYLKAKT